jgi:hypothetical protein
MSEKQVRRELEACLLTPDEIEAYRQGKSFADEWPL